ncbi:MAG: cysteine synthase A [Bacteriovoracaceae bacterium]|nr:cysteine synthase A [Bacteriovoracaceae bacterium]
MNTIIDTIGNTPLVKLTNISKELDLELYAKVESFNPGSSVKDRLAKALIEDAESRGILKHGVTIVEPSSGNTGIGIAMVAAMKGYSVVITMPETMSIERRKILKSFGATVELTAGPKGMLGAIEKAVALAEENENYITLGQFDNPANALAHYLTTGPEIVRELKNFDYFVAGVGTGGTITGVGRYLNENMPNAQIIAVEPEESPVLSGGRPGPHKIQGIGAGFIPKVLNTELINSIQTVSFESASKWQKSLSFLEGISCGVSSGAAVAAVEKLAQSRDLQGKKVVIVLPDTGERYLSATPE